MAGVAYPLSPIPLPVPFLRIPSRRLLCRLGKFRRAWQDRWDFFGLSKGTRDWTKWAITAVFSVKCRMQRLLWCFTLRLCSYEETRNVFQLKKACVSFVLWGKKPQTNVHSWCIHFHARWTQVMISNSVTTVSLSVAQPLFAILSDNLFSK